MMLTKFIQTFLVTIVALAFFNKASGAGSELTSITTNIDKQIGSEQDYRGLRKHCPSGPGITYVSRNNTCHINYLCVRGTEPFKVEGCGCGCRKVKTNPHPNTTCPSGSEYTYFTHKYPCVINFFCIFGKQGFSIPGCGCGCKTIEPTKPPKRNNTSTGGDHCPTGLGVKYVTHKYPCVVNFACISTSPVAFSEPGCGCGCKPRS